MSQFGLTTQGASDFTLDGTTDVMLVNQKICTFDGIIYSLAVYLKNFAASEFIRLSLYSDDGADAPDVLLACTDAVEGTGVDGWVTIELNMPVAVTNGAVYWIGVQSDASIDVAYNTDGSQNYRTITYGLDWGPISVWTGGTNSTRIYSLYADMEILGNRKWVGFKGNLEWGEAGWGSDINTQQLTRFTAVEDLTLTRMGVWTNYGGSAISRFEAGEYARMAIYSDTGADYPDALLGETAAFEGGAIAESGFYVVDLLSPVEITAGNVYWLGVASDTSDYCPDMNGLWHYDGVTWKSMEIPDTFTTGPQDPAGSPPNYVDSEFNLSIYAETAIISGGGGSDAQPGIMVDML